MIIKKIFYLCELIFVFLWELTKSNVQVSVEAFRWKPRLHPGFVAIPINFQDDRAILMLANLITMTPGTVTIDLSDDKKTLFAHGLFVNDLDEFRSSIERVLAYRVRRLFL
ncbi:MAG: Na+/H+ antiporter subunit E [Bdellovibrionaceae bacterium]|nr:Na+/H+ antiporter subunit E [Pseudobdellovibrionaceae bacterium]MDW8189899.1 Na+/H+ antiporter subunit E [Pseudobdellovibrionaceae bacterium]